MPKKRTPVTPEQEALLAAFTNPDLEEVDKHTEFGKQFTWGKEPIATLPGVETGHVLLEQPKDSAVKPANEPDLKRSSPSPGSLEAGPKGQRIPLPAEPSVTHKLPHEDKHDQAMQTTILLRVFTKTSAVISFNQLVNQVAMTALHSSTRIRGDILATLIDYAVRSPEVINHLATELTKTRKKA